MVLNNVFGPEATVRILYYKMRKEFKYIKPFLALLNILPEVIVNVGEEEFVYVDLIPMDNNIVEALRKI
jgi:hypothetical protein